MELFIITIALIWLIAATILDIKTKEIPNWINFSLAAIAIITYSITSAKTNIATHSILTLIAVLVLISALYFYSKEEKKKEKIKGISLFLIIAIIFLLVSYKTNSINLLFYSVATFSAFFILGTALYYLKQWGGGDAKLLAALGAAFPVYPQILQNIFSPKFGTEYFPLIILLNLLIAGSIYGIIMLIINILKNKDKFKKEFKEQNKKLRKITIPITIGAIIAIVLSFYLIETIPIRTMAIGILIIIPIITYLYLIIKSAESSSMFKTIPTTELREGDWITQKIEINEKVIYDPKSTGVTKEQIEIIKEHQEEIEIKEGIVFMPTFLIAIILSLTLGNTILWLV